LIVTTTQRTKGRTIAFWLGIVAGEAFAAAVAFCVVFAHAGDRIPTPVGIRQTALAAGPEAIAPETTMFARRKRAVAW
jgi:uncharacterized protein YbjQ (UPF0145 family)